MIRRIAGSGSILFVAWLLASACSPKPTLESVFQQQLDRSLENSLETARADALGWQADARLHQIRMNVDKDGAVTWKFHWLSDAAGSFLETFSGAASFRNSGLDPEPQAKATLEPDSTVGFDELGITLQQNGVDLAGVEPDQVSTIQLGHETHLDPAGYYYYVFLTSGKQHWVRANDGAFIK